MVDYVFVRQDAIVSRYEGQAPLGDLVQLYGFPSATEVKDVAAKTLGVSPRLLAVTLRDGSALPKFDTRLQMSMEYPDLSSDSVVGPDGSRHRPVHPDGMSGGGVWAVLFRNVTQCSIADVRLIGVQVSWVAAQLRARASRMSVPLMIIQRYFPELKPALELDLAHGV